MEKTLDYYQILHITIRAERAEIAAAYRRLCKVYHPDINHSPGAEEQMKRVNQAYHVLGDDARRRAYDNSLRRGRESGPSDRAAGPAPGHRDNPAPDEAGARRVMERYFDALQRGAHEAAYGLLSEYDRQYVTRQSFCKWRAAVGGIFPMRGFALEGAATMCKLTLEDGRTVTACRLSVCVEERDAIRRTSGQQKIAKHVIHEAGMWRVFLGYRDLNEIAQVFENLSTQHERGEMTALWKRHCAEHCRELDMLSRAGLLKAAEREAYRHRRYRQPVTLACFQLGGLPGEPPAERLESAALTMAAALRATDVSAYFGGGVFAVLLVGLQKRHAGRIVLRLAQRMEQDLRVRTGLGVPVRSAWELYPGGEMTACLDRLLKIIENMNG